MSSPALPLYGEQGSFLDGVEMTGGYDWVILRHDDVGGNPQFFKPCIGDAVGKEVVSGGVIGSVTGNKGIVDKMKPAFTTEKFLDMKISKACCFLGE